MKKASGVLKVAAAVLLMTFTTTQILPADAITIPASDGANIYLQVVRPEEVSSDESETTDSDIVTTQDFLSGDNPLSPPTNASDDEEESDGEEFLNNSQVQMEMSSFFQEQDPQASYTVEGEEMEPTGGSFNSGSAMLLWSNGELVKNLEEIELGLYDIEIQAMGVNDDFGDPALMQLKIDSRVIGSSVEVQHNDWNYQSYFFEGVELDKTDPRLSIEFLNSSAPRALWIDKIILRQKAPLNTERHVLEGETLQTTSSGTWVSDNAVLLWSNGLVHQSVVNLSGGNYEVEIVALSGDGQGGPAKMQLAVDDEIVGPSVSVTNNNWNFKSYVFKDIRLDSGMHDFGALFSNEDGLKQLWIDKIIIRKTSENPPVSRSYNLQAEAMNFQSPAVLDGNAVHLPENAVISGTQTTEAGLYDLTVKALGIEAGGVPQMRVAIDGVIVELTVAVTNNQGYYSQYVFKDLKLSAGPHTVSIEYTNDAGARELWIDEIELYKKAELPYENTKRVLEGETMTVSGGHWTSPNAMLLWSNGTLTQVEENLEPGIYELEVVAFGLEDGGLFPQMQAVLDGVAVSEGVDVPNNGWNNSRTVFNPIRIEGGAHELGVRYLNDGGNRDLWVDKMVLRKIAELPPADDQRTYEAESMTASGGYWQGPDSMLLWSHGNISQTAEDILGGLYELEIIALGVEGEGDLPLIQATIDGKIHAGQAKVTNNDWNYRSYTFTGLDLSAGDHDVAVSFLNDTGVRDLWIDKIILRRIGETPPDRIVIEGEAMVPTGGYWFSDDAAMLWSRGELGDVIDLESAGYYDIEVVALGQPGIDGEMLPRMEIKVDGDVIAPNVAVQNNNWHYQTYTYKDIKLAAGEHDLAAVFLNQGDNRALWIDKIIVHKTRDLPRVIVNDDAEFTSNRTVQLDLSSLAALAGAGGWFRVTETTSTTPEQSVTTEWFNFLPSAEFELTAIDGLHRLRVEFMNVEGQIGEYTAEIIVDMTQPESDIIVNNNGYITNSLTDMVVFKAFDAASGIDISSGFYSLDNGVNWMPISFSTGSINGVFLNSGPYKTSIGYGFDFSSEDDGIKNLLYRISDKAGNERSMSAQLILDRVPPSVTLDINSGNTITHSRNVTLTLAASDSTSGIDSMRLSVDDGSNWTEWENFKNSKPITLPAGDGLKTITLQTRDKAGNVVTVSNSIILDTASVTFELLSSSLTNQEHYLLVYNLNGIRVEEEVVLEEGKNFIVRSAQSTSGELITKTFEITLDSKPPVIEVFKINQGQNITKSSLVTLDLVAYDLGSNVAQMAFSNDGINFTESENYALTKSWGLEDTKGEKRVWVKLRDASGFWSDPFSTSIYYEKAHVLEDFDGPSLLDNFWDIDGPDVYERETVVSVGVDGGNAMRVIYHKQPGLDYSFFAAPLVDEESDGDFSGFRTLRLRLNKLSEPPMVLAVKLEFQGTEETHEAQAFFSQGQHGWQEVIYDISSVPQELLARVKTILFFVDPGNGTSVGEFLLDEIVLDEQVPSKLLDDYEGNDSAIGTYWDLDPGIYQREILEEAAIDGTHSMRVQYAKGEGLPYSLFAFQPVQNGSHNNFSSYGSLRFYLNKIAPAPFVLLIKLEFNDSETTFEKEVHFPSGSRQWQEVTFDFSEVPLELLSNVKNVLFFADPASETAQGAFYMDRLRLAEAPSTRLIDDFEGNSSYIESYYDIDGAGVVYTRSIDTTQSFDGTHAMRIEFHKTVQFPTSFFGFTPNQDGIINDFSRFNVLRVAVKKESLPSMKLMMKFDLEDTQINFESWKEIPQGESEWTELEFDFSSLKLEDLKKVRSVLFFVDPVFFTVPQPSDGVFYMDSIRLDYDPELPAKQYDPSRPPQLGWINSSVVSDLDNEYRSGSLVRINAWELNAAGDLLDGTVRIVSSSTGYDSGQKKLIFLHDGQFWPYHWDTTGLAAADDYKVIVTMRDKSGNEVSFGTLQDPALTISLTQGPPPMGQTIFDTDFSIPLTGGGEFAVKRSYDPMDGGIFDHQLGLSWHSGFDYFVQDFPDGTASLNLGAQGYFFFFKNTDGTYRSMSQDNQYQLIKLERGFELRLKDGTVYRFDSAPFVDLNTNTSVTWFITTARDRNQNETRFFYDVNRNLEKVVFPSGEEIRLEYSFREKDQFNTNKYKMDKIIGPTGLEWVYEHDVKGNLLSVTDPLGNKTQYEYGPEKSLLKKIIYPDLSTRQYQYDSQRRVTIILRNGVLEQEFIYGGKNDPVLQTKDALGRITKQEFSIEGLLIKSTDALGGITRYEYDNRRNLVKQVDAAGNETLFEYDGQGNLLQITNALGETTSYTHEHAFNQVTSMTNAKGEVTTYTYDNRGNLLQVTDASNASSSFTYDSRGNVIQFTDALGASSNYAYDARFLQISATNPLDEAVEREYDNRGNLIKITGTMGEIVLFNYDPLNRRISQTDPNGRTTTYAYDVMGRVISQTDAAGNTSHFEYDEKGQLISQTDVTGTETHLTYDAKGNLLTVTDALNHATSYVYDALDRVTEVHDARGNIQRIEYDVLGNPVKVTDASGAITRFEYDALSRVVKVVYPNGAEAVTDYDALGRVLSQTDDFGNRVEYTYDTRGNVLTAEDARGGVTQWTYDAAGRPVSKTDALGNTTSFTYDAAGQLIETQLPDGAILTSVYDASGRLIESIDPLGRSVSFEYDNAGNLTRKIDAAGQTTEFTYDALNRAIEQKDALDHLTLSTYDAAGRLTSITDANHNLTVFHYDDLGRLLERVYPDETSESYSYDANGNVISSTDRMGRILEMDYDEVNRLTGRQFSDGTSESYTYDTLGNVWSATNAQGTVTFEYDELGRLIHQTDVFGNVTDYAYDQAGNLLSMHAAIGSEMLSRDYTYDALNRLTKIEDEESRQTLYTYDVNSRLVSKILPNLASVEYSYNQASELTALVHKDASGNIIRSLGYSYDDRGLVTSESDSFEGTTSYEYDDLARLVSMTSPVLGLVTYALDALGNRTQVTSDEGTEDYSANELNQYVSKEDTVFEYDLNGNLIKQTDTVTGLEKRFEYNTLNQLVKVILEDGSQVAYSYDVLGHRIVKTTPAGTVRYLWDGNEVLAETNTSGVLLRSFTHGLEIDELLYQEDYVSGETLYFHTDHLMSTLALTGETGQLVESYSYDAYGNLSQIKDSAGNALSEISCSPLTNWGI